VQKALEKKSWVASLMDESEGRAMKVSDLKKGVRREKEKVREIWRLNCEQLAQYNAESVSNGAEIAALKARLRELESDGGDSEVHRQSTNRTSPHATVVEHPPVATITLSPRSVHATPTPGPETVTS